MVIQEDAGSGGGDSASDPREVDNSTGTQAQTGIHESMGKNIDQAPHRWTVVNDYTKTAITLASGLLAITVTFSGQLIEAKNRLSLILLLISWIFLVGAIASALLAAAYLSVYLGLEERDDLTEPEVTKKRSRSNRALVLSSAALYFLLGAAILFVGVGAARIFGDPKKCDEAMAAKTVMDVVSSVHSAPRDKLVVESFDLNSAASTYALVVSETGSPNKFSVAFDAKACKVIRSKRD